jgi:5-methylcytosine-specific restriction enzyme A
MAERIPAGIIRNHILAAIEDLREGVSHSFGESTTYDVLYEGRRYPPKAVVGLAAGELTAHVGAV